MSLALHLPICSLNNFILVNVWILDLDCILCVTSLNMSINSCVSICVLMYLEYLLDRCTTSPALFNRCVVDWFGTWSQPALAQVGYEFTSTIDTGLFASVFVVDNHYFYYISLV